MELFALPVAARFFALRGETSFEAPKAGNFAIVAFGENVFPGVRDESSSALREVS